MEMLNQRKVQGKCGPNQICLSRIGEMKGKQIRFDFDKLRNPKN